MRRLLLPLVALMAASPALAGPAANKGHPKVPPPAPMTGHKMPVPPEEPSTPPGAPAAHKGHQSASPVMLSGPVPDKNLFPFAVTEERLPSGLTLLFVPYDSPGLAAYYTLVRTGSRNEVEPGKSGFAHFFEHMMFRGTEKHPKDDYDQRLSRAGVSNNAFTTDDFTCYTVFGPSAALPLIVELEADRFQSLKYSREDFQTEAKAVLGEYNKNFSNPNEKLEEVLRDSAFQAHTYKHTTIGFEADVKAMPSMYEYSLEFFKRWYTPDQATILVVGDFDPAKVKALIAAQYAGWTGKSASIEIPEEPKQLAGKAVHVTWQNPTQGRLMMGFHTPEARSDAKDAAIQNVLGPYLFGPTSPTYKDLVLDRQLVTGVDVWYSDHRDPSLFYLLATLKSDDAFPQVRETILKVIAELREGRVDEKRLTDVKSNQKYSLLKGLDNASSVALQMVFAMGPTGDPKALNALFNQMDALTTDDLVKFAKQHLVETNLTEVTLTGKGGKAPANAKEYVPSQVPAVKGGGK